MTEQEITLESSTRLTLHTQRALKAVLGGKPPAEEDVSALTGTAKACIVALADALAREGGVLNVHKAFNALLPDYPWLGKLAGMPNLDDPEAIQEAEKSKRKIHFVPTSEIMRMPRQHWLIPDILPRDGLTLVYGEPGCYKSFLVIDWTLSLATGSPWLGRSLVRGYVAYIAAEGSYGLKKRVNAWLTHRQRYYHSEQDLDLMLSVKWYCEPMMLQDMAQLAELLTSLQEDFPEPPALVVIDTLSRCSAGVEEDSNSEMARVLASADIIRQQLHCTVLIVHHVGKDAQRGPRGASALMGNVETALLISPREGGNKIESTKAKDAAPFEPIRLLIQESRFGPHPDDASLVLVPDPNAEDRDLPRMTQTETLMLSLLQGKELTYTEWKKAGVEAKVAERLAEEAIGKLRKAGFVHQIRTRGPYIAGPAPESSSLQDPLQEEDPAPSTP